MSRRQGVTVAKVQYWLSDEETQSQEAGWEEFDIRSRAALKSQMGADGCVRTDSYNVQGA